MKEEVCLSRYIQCLQFWCIIRRGLEFCTFNNYGDALPHSSIEPRVMYMHMEISIFM